MITLTDNAAAAIKRIAAEEGFTDLALRMKVMGGGCSGFTYDLAFVDGTTQAKPADDVFVDKGVTLVVDPMSLQYLDGTDIDYVSDNMLGAGFRFNNPNSKGSCGCGSSFSA